MKWTGEAKKLQPGDMEEAAASINVSEAALRAVISVETPGTGFGAGRRLRILFERHIFWRELGDTPARRRAANEGLAYPKWGTRRYPRGQAGVWREFLQACEIDETAAIKSTSWGLGQIMGREYDEAGYDSPQAMVDGFNKSEYNQLIGMCKLIQRRGLDRDLRKFPAMANCRHFAYRYNGAGYRKNKYHTKLQSAYNDWASRVKSNAPMDDDDGVLRRGSRGERVRALQRMLNQRKYLCRVDGIFGTRTRDMVLAWQADSDVACDGDMSPEDMAALDRSPTRPIDAEREEVTAKELKKESTIVKNSDNAGNIIKGTAVVAGGASAAQEGGLLDKAPDIADKAEQVSGIVDTVRYALSSGLQEVLSFVHDNIVIISIIAGAGVLYYLWKVKKARVDMQQTGEAV